MNLKGLAEIHPGYLNRATIRPSKTGSHYLVQARDVDAGIINIGDAALIRFEPEMSSRDVPLRDGDVLFMTRGTKNYAALLTQVPEPSLAAASFFVVRVTGKEVDPAYLAWYLNQPMATRYFTQHSGRGVHMPVVRRAVLEEMEVPVPPLATQKKIAELFRLSLEEQSLTKELLEKRARLMHAACLRAAERENS